MSATRVGVVLFYLSLSCVGAALSASAAEQEAEGCVTCHQAIGVEKLTQPVKDFPQDIHAAKGFGCVACHGGDAKDPGMSAMDRKKGFVGAPARKDIAQVCGHCHSDARFMRQYNPSLRVDQAAEYETSVHGQRLARNADAKVAVCVSCHPAHSIRPPSDPRSSVHPLKVAETCGRCHADAKYMATYKIATDQLEKYKKSVHWKMISVNGDLSAPTCNDCHGNHGAAPPGVSWVGNVCGQCHVQNEELFAKSVHAKVFVNMGIPGCATCHSNHEVVSTSDEMLGVGANAACAGCHTDQDKGGATAVEMRRAIDALRNDYEKAHAALSKAEGAGMEVSQPQFELGGAKTALIKARAAIHAFNVDGVRKETEPGVEISSKAYARGIKALDEIQFRRKGLAVSVLIIAALIVGLVLKIRNMEKPK
jgi:predicted CXXCH cytochrome family protein